MCMYTCVHTPHGHSPKKIEGLFVLAQWVLLLQYNGEAVVDWVGAKGDRRDQFFDHHFVDGFLVAVVVMPTGWSSFDHQQRHVVKLKILTEYVGHVQTNWNFHIVGILAVDLHIEGLPDYRSFVPFLPFLSFLLFFAHGRIRSFHRWPKRRAKTRPVLWLLVPWLFFWVRPPKSWHEAGRCVLIYFMWIGCVPR